MIEEGRGRDHPRVDLHPHVRNPEKYPNFRSDNKRLPRARQTPSRCHWAGSQNGEKRAHDERGSASL